MTINKRENLYRGVNAHLHSMAQNPHKSPTIWRSIHSAQIIYLTDALNELLPDDYTARAEASLQIWTEDIDTGDYEQRMPIPDTGIYKTGTSPQPSMPITMQNDPSIRLFPMREVFEDTGLSSVVIYRPLAHDYFGEPVTRFELLSYTNKVGKTKQLYLQNRRIALMSGSSLVELDYLHQTPPIVANLPMYPSENDSHPYMILVSDRREGKNIAGMGRAHVFGVDEPISQNVLIPLADDDSVVVDFDAVYQRMFVAGKWHKHIDYSQLPPRYDTYSPKDQDRIKAVMERAKTE
jgi:hypothetical protein